MIPASAWIYRITWNKWDQSGPDMRDIAAFASLLDIPDTARVLRQNRSWDGACGTPRWVLRSRVSLL